MSVYCSDTTNGWGLCARAMPLVVVLNDDLEFCGPWIEPLMEALTENALAGPALKYCGPDGFGYDSPVGKYRYLEGWCVAGRYGLLRRWPWLFDPVFVPQLCEDVDLGIRVVESGGTLREVPLPIRHKRSQTTGIDRPYWEKNRKTLQKKWKLA